jgi:hypothetical protein
MKRRDFVRTMSAVGAGLLLKPGAPLSLYAQEAAADPAVSTFRRLSRLRAPQTRAGSGATFGLRGHG